MTIEWPGPFRDYHLDSNRINGFGTLKYINELEMWRDRGVIMLGVSDVIYEEVICGDRTGRRGAKAAMEPRSETLACQPHERRLCNIIALTLFGEGGPRSPNEHNDVYALFCAQKYHRTFITNDGSGGKERGILTHRTKLKNLGVTVMTDREAVLDVRKVLKVRIRTSREICAFTGELEPNWISVFEQYELQNPV